MNSHTSTASYVFAYYPPVWKVGVSMPDDHAVWIEDEVEAHRDQAMIEHVDYADYYEKLEAIATKSEVADGENVDAVDRTWARNSKGELVRVLFVERYDDDGNPDRCFAFRLHEDDPRPMGRHCSGQTLFFNDLLGTLPIGVWSELVWQ